MARCQARQSLRRRVPPAGFRQAGERFEPESPVRQKLFRGTIGGVGFQKNRDRLQGPFIGRASGEEGGIDLRHTGADDRGTPAVEYQVVDPIEPEVPVGCNSDDRVLERGLLRQIDRVAKFLRHPRLGGGDRVRDGTQVKDLDFRLARGSEVLARRLTVSGEPQAEGVGFLHRLPHSGDEEVHDQVASDVEVFADVAEGSVGGQLLNVPDTALGPRQFVKITLGSRHGRIPPSFRSTNYRTNDARIYAMQSAGEHLHTARFASADDKAPK